MSDTGAESTWTKNFSKSQQRCGSKPQTAEQASEGAPAKRQKVEDSNFICMIQQKDANHSSSEVVTNETASEKRSVAIIVPFRDQHAEQKRKEHLDAFVPHMTKFLSKAGATDFCIYIVEQSDDNRKFNRGKLLNIGFKMAEKAGHNIFIFHDVDLLPQDEISDWYVKFPTQPLHIARCWGRYNNNKDYHYFGGIVSFSATDMRKINGYPNNFWGWGGEDDEMMKRVKACKQKPESPDKFKHANAIVDLENMGLNEKLGFLKKTNWKCNVKWELLKEHDDTWKENGLSNLNFKEISSSPMGEKGKRVVVDVLSNHHWTDDITHWDNLEAKIAEWKEKNISK